jgi:hypothetical protein
MEHMNTNGSNGNGKLGIWLAGFLIPPLIGSVVAWIGNTSNRTQSNAEHIAVLEAHMSDMRDELHRIGGKLDRILDHK